MISHGRFLRWQYRGGRPSRSARIENRIGAFLAGRGVWPSRLAALEIKGRLSGRQIVFPVVLADLNGERYVVSMLGERANWVANLRAADGRAVLRHGRRDPVHLEEVPVDARAPILRRYLCLAPGARPHIPIDRRAAPEDFAQVAPSIPVFRIESRTG